MHDASGCRTCEVVPDDAYRRHWKHQPKAGAWHVIADGPDLMARLPRQAHFVTVLAYRLTSEGRHYTGPLYVEFDGDLTTAWEDLHERCLPILEYEYECPLGFVRIWHSGGRGFHMTILAGVIGAEDGHLLLPQIYRAMVEKLFPPSVALTLDRSIYSAGKGRMWRLPNRRRSDTGRYKVPLSLEEALINPEEAPFHPADGLYDMTAQPRKGVFWLPDEELSPCQALVELYRETAPAVEPATPRPLMHDADMRIPLGQRNATLARMAGAMRRQGMSEAAIATALLMENQRCDPPLAEQEVRGIAASIARYRSADPPNGHAPVHGDRRRTVSAKSERWPSHISVEVI